MEYLFIYCLQLFEMLSYFKAYINGLLDLKDVENSVNCKYYEECENE